MLPTPPQSPKPFGLCAPEDRINHILAGRIQLTGILGVGAYGTVYQAVDLQTNVQYAVKALNKAGLDPRQRRFQEREIRLHHLANEHANVVSMLKIWDTPDCTYVVLEYCTEGDLFAKITDEGDYIGDDHKTREVFLQILDAVQHCHSRGIYHRDLKPENILVKDDGWTVKLADFGLATQDSITSDYGCGSTFYMSPECQESYTNPLAGYKSVPNDVWSLGVILVNLTCGRNPWKRASIEDSTFRAYRQDPDFLQTILPISTEINDILQRIFDVNPETRIGLHELRDRIAHCRFFSQGTQEAAERLECMLPPTPEMTPRVSPVGKPIDSVNLPYSLEPVPEVDLLPCSGFSQYINSQPTTPYGILTPPNSNPGSPQLLPQLSPQPLQYTFPVRPVPPVPNLPTTYQTGFSPFFPSTFSKYSGFVPQLGTFCWRNGPISVW